MTPTWSSAGPEGASRREDRAAWALDPSTTQVCLPDHVAERQKAAHEPVRRRLPWMYSAVLQCLLPAGRPGATQGRPSKTPTEPIPGGRERFSGNRPTESRKSLWARVDLNHRPHAYQAANKQFAIRARSHVSPTRTARSFLLALASCQHPPGQKCRNVARNMTERRCDNLERIVPYRLRPTWATRAPRARSRDVTGAARNRRT